jgi:Protein of unknown function (DUF429)
LPDELASVPHHVPARWGNPGYCPPAPPYRVTGWRRGLAVAASWGVDASSLQNVADLRFNLGMRTLGIDLASQDERTAMAGIAWRQGVGIVEKPISPVSNEDALRAMKDAAWIGIDAPFGWPDSSSRYSLPTQRLASGPRISMTRRSVCGSPTSSSETTWEFGHSASHPIGSLCRRGAVLDSSPPTRLKALTALDVATSSRSIRALRLRSGTSRDAATSAAAMVSARLSNDRPARL